MSHIDMVYPHGEDIDESIDELELENIHTLRWYDHW